MLTYRIAPGKFALDLSGEGARLAGGRWNERGSQVIYTSEHPSLALLETLPGFDLSTAPPGIQLVTIQIPDMLTILTLDIDKLPPDWRSFPHKPSTARIGQEWIVAAKASVLRVPSVMAPPGRGWNLLLNPLHPELYGKMVLTVEDWDIDGRLISKLT